MKLLSDIFAGGHASFVAAAFASAIAMIGAELLLLRRRSRRTREPRA
jgi:hypothetical protein